MSQPLSIGNLGEVDLMTTAPSFTIAGAIAEVVVLFWSNCIKMDGGMQLGEWVSSLVRG